MASWSDLPLDLLGTILACFGTSPVNRVRIAAVCRSWRAAVRHHERRRLPWVVSWDDRILIPFDGCNYLPCFPEDGVGVVGSTDSWLAVGLGTKQEFEEGIKCIYTGYVLHNPFSNTTVPFTVLNDVIINIGTCLIRKFLMRSTVDDFIAVVTNNENYPLIVFRQGRAAWVPQPRTAPYIHIIDVAFLEDTLYAITKAEDLIPLNLDCDGTPMVTIGKRIIRQPPGYDDYDAWSTSDDGEDDKDDDDDNDGKEEDDGDDDDIEEEDNKDVSDDDGNIEEENMNILDEVGNIEEDGNEDNGEQEIALDEEAAQEDDGSHNLSFSGEFTNDEATGELIMISRHLIVSCGKLLMVRRHKYYTVPIRTRRVEILEADASTGAWVPLHVCAGLGGDRAVFISTNFSKSVSAPCGEVEEDVIYDISTGEVFDIKTQTSRHKRFCIPSQGITWLFPPELVL